MSRIPAKAAPRRIFVLEEREAHSRKKWHRDDNREFSESQSSALELAEEWADFDYEGPDTEVRVVEYRRVGVVQGSLRRKSKR